MYNFYLDPLKCGNKQFSISEILLKMSPTNDEGPEPPHIVILDGGFSTQLSCHVGHVIDGDPLWSARFLSSHPEDVVNTHLDFLRGRFFNKQYTCCKYSS